MVVVILTDLGNLLQQVDFTCFKTRQRLNYQTFPLESQHCAEFLHELLLIKIRRTGPIFNMCAAFSAI